MRISEAISKLTAILQTHGDMELRIADRKHFIIDIRYCRDDDILHDDWTQIDSQEINARA